MGMGIAAGVLVVGAGCGIARARRWLEAFGWCARALMEREARRLSTCADRAALLVLDAGRNAVTSSRWGDASLNIS